MTSGENVQDLEWVETWEDADGRKWELSWWEYHGAQVVELGCHGRLIGQNGIPGLGKALDFLCSYSVLPSSPGSLADDDYGSIDGVKVQPAYRGTGIGSMLVERGMAWMKSKGCKGCIGMFQNDDDNDARERFWKRLGVEILFNAIGQPTWVRRSF